MDEFARTRQLLELLNIGVVKCLEKKTHLGVCKVELEQRAPADRHNVLMWEQRNTCFLPEDLKSFFLTSDGFQLTWNVKMDNGPQPLGKMRINRVSQLVRIGGTAPTSHVNPSLADLEGDSDQEDEVSGLEKPTFDNRCKIYELDPCDGYGKVCLVYRESKAEEGDVESYFGGNEPKIEIWFLDRALRWHYLTDSFIAYYRLMLMHLGLPQWQYALTDIGLSQQTQQWFNVFAQVRLELDRETLCETSGDSKGRSQSSQLDINKVFKGKTDKRKTLTSQTQQQNPGNMKKKPLVPSAKTQSVPGTRVTASSSQISNKGVK
ncbi:tubulin polyglutamylase complex subunit 2-like isoform X4 [Pecten maximus]|uniref:tubulin polyglutamylase complex subunit 2-like isoform X3 n=1 Tax=Pecten maximus TaxID=6579 RepID=UPI001458378F|nr:tubulin polyglutamylase complex subunit 2-like isoform X3 [Pecten maximus]XP_033742973.1 tubulin polyglutamylase complex subunit 2-like isoform X4 [Pecten maximus]